MDIKKLLVRACSGTIYVGVIIGCILWGDMGVALLGAILAISATIEFEKICQASNNCLYNPELLFDVIAVFLLSISFNPIMPIVPIVLWMIVIIARFILELYRKNKNPLKSLELSMLTQIYIGLPLASMSAAAFFYAPKMVLLVFIMLWLNDTGAYLVGSLIGKNKLFERISPKKSWEGFFGGLFFNILLAIFFFELFPDFGGKNLNIVEWCAMGIIVTVFGTWGDLIESMIKRHLNIKDSGSIIPGHGGILDRIDSFLLAMPTTLIFLLLLTFIK